MDSYYVGQTGNPEDRLLRHNGGRSKSTKRGIPWVIVYEEKFESRVAACAREMEIKRKKSKEFIERLAGKAKSTVMKK